MATFTAGVVGVDFDILDLGPLAFAAISGATPTSIGLTVAGVSTQLFGSGFSFAAGGPPTAGAIGRIIVGADVGTIYDIAGLNQSAAQFRGWVLAGDSASAKAGLFFGDDMFTGSNLADRLRGYAGADTMVGGGGDDFLDGGDGDDMVFGGLGNDTIVDPGGSNYLRGDEGDDVIVGGAGFDDINGNMGDDTLEGGPGDDWVVGGKDEDRLSGGAGNDLVYGNLGDDTCDGGAGNDTVRGGQGNDILAGGAGDDFISGDRGDDTMTGGGGADIFHSSSDAGIDRVLDFSVAQGDRVQLDPGTTYTVIQDGADTVIQMSEGQVVLVGVSMTSLLGSSIFVG
ncbi:calcium-binding protein [Phenylobacterium sp.]|uniref:calcium-binding protein n=1 Tax=Phenylobacterium sp. TaxID=1871053 RepID=UPI0025E5FC50|nr:calcium-binding protein [Phenylobacterium sp.]MBX3483729.1 calcium-binding protein [Phenylobacterium sp.]MCW5758144.1 calcium-binding protein [Phenylobacterium sp.]